MSDESSGNVSFSIDERARLFAFDIDRKGHIGLLPLFRDISRVLEAIDETNPTGGGDGLETTEIVGEVYDDLESDIADDIVPLLEFLEELDYLEQTTIGTLKLKSSENSGSGVYSL